MPRNEQEYSNGYLRYALGLLVVVYTFNFVDRQILAILQESIKKEMGLSDGQLGLLTGFSFAAFYVTLGVPIARLADRGNRRNIIAWSMALWSLMTGVCGLAANYVQLLVARMLVGVGEAGGSPPAHAIVSDYFPPERRGRALGIYSMGAYTGVLVGFVAGGWLNQTYGWRVALMAIGFPGMLVALLVRLTIREPRRGRMDGVAAVVEAPPFLESARQLWALPSFRSLALGAGLTTFVTYGVGNFAPSYLARAFAWTPRQIGTALGLATGIGGIIGTFMGGWLGDRLGARDKRWYLWIPAIALTLGIPLKILAFQTGSGSGAVLFGAVADMLALTFLSPSIAMSHALVPPELRAFASSVLFLILNLIGLGLGPVFTGFLSDRLGTGTGPDGLRLSLLATTLAWIPAALAYWWASKSLRQDITRRVG